MTTKTPTLVLLAVAALSLTGCDGGAQAAVPLPAVATAPAAPAADAPGVSLTVTYPFIQPTPFTIAGTQAFVWPNANVLALVDGDVTASCADRPWASGSDLGADNYVVELQFDQPPTVGAAARPRYTVYYPRDGHTTNSGNSATAPSNQLGVTFTRVDAERWIGTVSGAIGGDATMQGSFTATVCR